MTSGNLHLPARYDERRFHLALGIEPTDATSGQRLPSSVDVRIEDVPVPVDRWRAWRPGETLTPFLTPMPRHRTGRFALLHHQRRTPAALAADIDLRIVDNRSAGFGPGASGVGQGRRIVPRRLRITVPSADAVSAADTDPDLPPVPQWQRAFAPACFPGADGPLAAGATVVRGLVRRDDGTGRMAPVRWARVRATNTAGDEVGWAHGDDRGEFVLVVEHSLNDIVVPPDPLPIDLTIGFLDPPPQPDPADPLRSTVDPLWDLPLEVLVPALDPATVLSMSGRRFLPGSAVTPPSSPSPPIAVAHGRQVSIVLTVP